ncbi:MAG: PQQ-like beta-propeller repeat protein, partial [Thermoleophilia bacterium]|nr:PQQ-like beta-propeller repeat protein [Thermoleophilia bacterium]
YFFYALDANTGEKKWEFVADRPILVSPVVSSAMVLFGSEDGNFHSLDSASGTEKWRIETGRGINTVATVFNDLVFFTNRKGSIYCARVSDGAIEYVEDGIKPSTQLVSAGELILFGSGTKLVAINALTGLKAWEHGTASTQIAPPVIAHGIACFGSGNYLYGVDAADGTLKWETMTGSPPKDGLAVFDGFAYFTTLDHGFFAVEIESGDILFSHDLGRFSHTQPAVNDEWILFGGDDHNLYGYPFATKKADESLEKVPPGMAFAPEDDPWSSLNALAHPYSIAQAPWRLFVLAFLFPVYEFYWFYRNWRHWEIERGAHVRPGLRTLGMIVPVLNYYLAYDQFRMVNETARKEKVKSFSLFLVTTGYLSFIALPNSLSWLAIFFKEDFSEWQLRVIPILQSVALALVPLFLVVVQRTNNRLWGKKYPSSPPRDFFTAGEKMMIALGCLYWAITLIPAILRLF